MKIKAGAQSVITGAASGFGRALALELASRGGRLVLADIDTAGLALTAQLAKAKGAVSCREVRCDVSRLEEVEALLGACDGPIDLLVNNAGVSAEGAIGVVPLEDWRWVLDIDLWGVIHGCHVFVPRFKEQGHGHILNVASAAGLLLSPRMAPYNVAKAGVIALSDTLASELDGTGVGVTVLCPTFFQTQIVASGRFQNPDTKKTAEKFVALGRTPDVIARRALKAVERNRRYCLPMADARLAWFWKRVFPGAFGKIFYWLEKIDNAFKRDK